MVGGPGVAVLQCWPLVVILAADAVGALQVGVAGQLVSHYAQGRTGTPSLPLNTQNTRGTSGDGMYKLVPVGYQALNRLSQGYTHLTVCT